MKLDILVVRSLNLHTHKGSSVHSRVQNKTLRRGLWRELDDQEEVCVASSSSVSMTAHNQFQEEALEAQRPAQVRISMEGVKRTVQYLDSSSHTQPLQLIMS